MIRPHLTRRLLAAALAAALATGGCTAGGGPTATPEPTPQSRYQQPPEDLCEQIQIEDVLHQQDLSMPYQPDSSYNPRPTLWIVSCTFQGLSEESRFATELGDFGSVGTITLWVYRDPTDAAPGFELHASSSRNRAEIALGATTGAPIGWWDAGASLTLVNELESGFSVDETKIRNLDTELLVRHENLLAILSMRTHGPTELVAEMSDLLHGLLAALLDEAVGQLTLTTG